MALNNEPKIRLQLIDSPAFSESGYGEKPEPSLGLAYLAAVLQNNSNCTIRLIDSYRMSNSKIIEDVSDFSPAIVGLTSMTYNINQVAELAKNIKRVNNPIILIGGSHGSALPKRTLKEFSWFDIVVIGEGESTIAEIINNYYRNGLWENIDKIKGIAYKSQEGTVIVNEPRETIKELDSLPYPKIENYNFNLYRKQYIRKLGGDFPRIPIETSRGCPFSCPFCYRLFGKRWRAKSPKRVVDEIEYYYEQINGRLFEIIDATATLSRKRFLEICEEIKRRGLDKKIAWICETRVDSIDEELASKMYTSGCVYVFFGLESGDNEVLAKINKKITAEQIKKAVQTITKNGMRAGGSFIIGHPYDSKKSILNTINLAKELRKLGLEDCSFQILDVYPETENWYLVEEGVNNSKWIDECKYNWNSYNRGAPQITMDNLIENDLVLLREKAISEFKRAYFRLWIKDVLSNYLKSNKKIWSLTKKLVTLYEVKIKGR